MSVWDSAFFLKGLTTYNCVFLYYSHQLNLFQWFMLKIPKFVPQSCIDPDDLWCCNSGNMGWWSLGSLIATTVLPGGSSVVE